MSQINKLTEQQIAKFPEYVEKWKKIGLCTDAANRPEAEKAIYAMYECAGFKRPERIVWCGSPLSQGIVRAIILEKKLTDSVGASVGARVGAGVWASVWASVKASVKTSVGDSVWDSVGASVWDSVWNSVGGRVRARVRASGAGVGDSVWDSVYGQHGAHWLAVYDFFNNECGLNDQTSKVAGLWALAKTAGWAIPHENVCFVSERHCILERDENGRLHNDSGAAVMYPDGWSIYAYHGVRVPEKIITEKHKTTVSDIEKEHNTEVKRVMMELYGMERYFYDSGAKPIDKNVDQFGRAMELYQLPGAQFPMLKVTNSSPEPDGTFKNYVLTATRKASTALEAAASLAGTDSESYIPVLES